MERPLNTQDLIIIYRVLGFRQANVIDLDCVLTVHGKAICVEGVKAETEVSLVI